MNKTTCWYFWIAGLAQGTTYSILSVQSAFGRFPFWIVCVVIFIVTAFTCMALEKISKKEKTPEPE